MFTGIIEKQTKVISSQKQAGNVHVVVAKPSAWKLSKGQSIAIDGVCSTVVAAKQSSFDVQYIPETLSKTNAAGLQKGSMVNLERSLKFGTRIDGHLVQGHVDATAKVARIKTGKSHLIAIELPKSLAYFAALHGSIALNGVSLTIAKTESTKITVALIPHTLSHTNLKFLKKGDLINVEVDMQARYARLKPHAKKGIRKKG